MAELDYFIKTFERRYAELEEKTGAGFAGWLASRPQADTEVGDLGNAVQAEWNRYDTTPEGIAAFDAACDKFFAALDKHAAIFIESQTAARPLMPAFVGTKKGHTYNVDLMEIVTKKLSSWIASPSGLGQALPAGFWPWFESTGVYPKFVKLENEMSDSFGSSNNKFEDLAKQWDQTVKWAVREFAAVEAQPSLAGVA